MTNILFKPTLLVRHPFSFPLKPHHLTRPFLRFTLTESERDIEVMPGGNYDDVDALRSDKLPFAAAVSWVLHVRRILSIPLRSRRSSSRRSLPRS